MPVFGGPAPSLFATLPTDDELRERGFTDDQIGELRGKREAAERDARMGQLDRQARLAFETSSHRPADEPLEVDGPEVRLLKQQLELVTEQRDAMTRLATDNAQMGRLNRSSMRWALFAGGFALFNLGWQLSNLCRHWFEGTP